MAIPGTEEVLRTWMRRLWDERDPSVIDELFAPQGSAAGLEPRPVVGAQEFHAFYAMVAAAIVNTSVIIEHIMTKGDEALLVATFRGTHKKTTKEVTMRFAAHAVVRDGKIVDATNILDVLSLLQQIGEAAPDALPRALA